MKTANNQLKYPDSRKHIEVVRTALTRAIEFLEIAESETVYARNSNEIQGRYSQELIDIQTEVRNIKLYIINDLWRNE